MATFGDSQFRESAIVRNANPEPLDDLAQLTAPREWVVLACLGLVLGAIVVWGAFGSVERTLRTEGALVFSGERRTIPSSASGVIVEVLARQGDRVVAGQSIVRIAPAGIARPAGFSSASHRAAQDEPTGATGGTPSASERLLASTKASLNYLAPLPSLIDLPSPGLGVIATVLVTPGDSVAPGYPVAELVSGDGDRLAAVAFIARDQSWPLAVGMTARLSIHTPEGRRSFPGELIEVAPRAAPPPDWLTRMRPDTATLGRGHLLRFTIADSLAHRSAQGTRLESSLNDGIPSRIEIILEHTSPFGLMIRR